MSIIIMKYDDLCIETIDSFCRVADYSMQNHFSISMGIIGRSLETNNQQFFDLCKKWIANNIELWNHGYIHTKEEFSVENFSNQCESIKKTQELAKEKLGLNITTFGSPHNNSTEVTITALSETAPEIKNYLFAVDSESISDARQLLIRCNMETFPGNIEFDYFLEQYELNKEMPFLVIQGHPGAWKEKDFRLNEQIIQFLNKEGHTFSTPSELVVDYNEKSEMRDPLYDLIVKSRGKFALYGAGEIGRELIKYIKEKYGVLPQCFIVSDEQFIGQQYISSCPVLPYSEFKNKMSDCLAILSLMPAYHETIIDSLRHDNIQCAAIDLESAYLRQISNVRRAIFYMK